MTKTIPQQMTGVILKGHGGYEQLELRRDLPVPSPGAGEVLVKVGAAGVNNTDINTRIGWYSKSVTGGTTADAGAGGIAEASGADASWAGAALEFPRIQGADVCGRIVAVGEGVDEGRIGARILIEPCLREPLGWRPYEYWYLGSECDGGFAQFVKVASRHAVTIESDLSDIELASFPCSYSTAENMIVRSSLGRGETVLITGASGGVGSAAIQLAKLRGAHVVAVTSKDKAEKLRTLGADQIVLRESPLSEILQADSVDVVIDLVAGQEWSNLLEILRRGGRYATSGAIAGPIVELDVRTLYLKDLSLFGCTMLGLQVFESLVRYIAAGEIKPLVAATFPLSEIVAAQKAFLEKKHIGKIVLEIPR